MSLSTLVDRVESIVHSIEGFLIKNIELASNDKSLLIPYMIVLGYKLKNAHFYRYIRKYVLPLGAAVVLYRASSGYEDSLLVLIQRWLSAHCGCLTSLAGINRRSLQLIVGDLAGVLVISGIWRATNESLSLDPNNLKKSVLNGLFGLVKDFWFVKEQIECEKSKMKAGFEKDLKVKTRAMKYPHVVLPEKGLEGSDIINLMKELATQEDCGWRTGKLSGGVYHGIRSHQELLNAAYSVYSLTNPLHADIWPSTMKFESEIISMTSSLVNNDVRAVCGSVTSGGTESIILAIKTHRDYYRLHHNITHPEMIACVSAHAAVDKGCEILGIKLIKVPMYKDGSYRIDIGAVKAAIGPNTILLYGSAPSYPQGVIDDIKSLSNLAVKYSVGLHVDACLGGFVLPFARKLGYPIPEFDFALPGVSSMSMDTHKYGYALKGTSVVLYRNTELRQCQYFCYAEWPGGLYATPTIAGSRSGGLIAQTWASLVALGEEGYRSHVQSILTCTQTIAAGIADSGRFPTLKLLGNNDTEEICKTHNHNKNNTNDNTYWAKNNESIRSMIVCFGMKDDRDANTIYSIMDVMTKKYSWALSSHQHPACAHLCVTVCHVGRENDLLNDLEKAVQEVESSPDCNKHGSAAIYGLTSSLPTGPVNDILRVYNDVVLTM